MVSTALFLIASPSQFSELVFSNCSALCSVMAVPCVPVVAVSCVPVMAVLCVPVMAVLCVPVMAVLCVPFHVWKRVKVYWRRF
jgi:hypothetical protein